MTGERALSLAGAARRSRQLSVPQPGGREPAPGELVLVQSFINSHYDLVVEHGRDLLATPDALGLWLAERELVPEGTRLSAADVERSVAAREGLRALARANNDGRTPLEAPAIDGLNRAAAGAAVELRFGAAGPQLVTTEAPPLDRALGVVLAIAVRAMIDGTFAKLKACPGDDCGWAFYDHSRNQSGRWCSMAVCGGRAKARSHYHRRRRGAG